MQPQIIGVIPARGGSKGIIRKNIRKIAGRPLIEWTIEAALNSQKLDKLIVSTDDEEIAKVAQSAGADVPFLRPPQFSGDHATALQVITHALKTIQPNDFQGVAYLQPTSPLRTSHDIDSCIDLLSSGDSVVSVCEIPHQCMPTSLMKIAPEGNLAFHATQNGKALSRLNKTGRYYFRNGPAVLITKVQDIMNGKLYGDNIIPYIMPKQRSIDIDDHEDFMIAEALIKQSLSA